MRGNCLIFAACKWWSGGGYLCMRMSRVKPDNRWLRWLKWPHFLWVKSLDGIPIQQMVPAAPQRGWRLLFHPLWFEGYVRGCDSATCKYHATHKDCKFCYDDDPRA